MELTTSITTDNGTPVVSSLDYDDGNLFEYDGINYTYNAENRLIEATSETPADGDKKVEYVYDYMGRRAKKAVYDYSSGSWLLSSDSLFLYDGWNLVKKVDAADTVYYVNGLDLSGSLQGAGGIGGLLARVDGADTHLYTFDGNGNVGQLVSASDGTVDAHYQYDPFGNITSASGTLADVNPFRFSSKYADDETGLLYYGYRYYSPILGRWINRDPIGEKGGLNLYLFVRNNSVNLWDRLGLLSPKLKDYEKSVFDWKLSFSLGGGGAIKINVETESGKRCCNQGAFKGQYKEIREVTFGPELDIHAGAGFQLAVAGVGFNLEFVGPKLGIKGINVTRTYDECCDDKEYKVTLLNTRISPSINGIKAGFGNLLSLDVSAAIWIDFFTEAYINSKGIDVDFGILADYDVSVKGFMGWEEYTLLDVDSRTDSGDVKIPILNMPRERIYSW